MDETNKWREFEEAKQQLSRLATSCAEYEQLCKAIAQRYRV